MGLLERCLKFGVRGGELRLEDAFELALVELDQFRVMVFGGLLDERFEFGLSGALIGLRSDGSGKRENEHQRQSDHHSCLLIAERSGA